MIYSLVLFPGPESLTNPNSTCGESTSTKNDIHGRKIPKIQTQKYKNTNSTKNDIHGRKIPIFLPFL